VDVNIESACIHKSDGLGDVATVQNIEQVSLAHDGCMSESPRLVGMEKGTASSSPFYAASFQVVDGTHLTEPFTEISRSGEVNNDILNIPELQGGSSSSDSPKDLSPAMIAASLNTNAMTSDGHLYADRAKQQEVNDYGGITEASMMTLRSSERVRSQANADATQLERAIALAQKKDDAYISGTCEKLKS
jgi:hypothetical protein